MHYRALREFPGVHWGFLIATGDQLVQIASGIPLEGKTFTLIEGRGVLSCTIPRLPLVAGTYVIKGAIVEHDTRIPIAERGNKTSPTVFTVRSTVDARNNIRAMIQDLVVIDVIWDSP